MSKYSRIASLFLLLIANQGFSKSHFLAPKNLFQIEYSIEITNQPKPLNRTGFGFTGGSIENLHPHLKAFYDLLYNYAYQHTLSLNEWNSLLNRFVRIKEGSIQNRPTLLNTAFSDDLINLRFNSAHWALLIQNIQIHQKKYRTLKNTKGQPLLSEKQIHRLLFERLIPFEWFEFLLSEGLSKTFAYQLLTSKNQPLQRWQNDIKPALQLLIQDEHLSHSNAFKIAFTWANPIKAWLGDEEHPGLKNIQSELAQFIPLSKATTLVVGWGKNALPIWFGNEDKIGLSQLKDQLIKQEFLSESEALEFVISRQNPLQLWNEELKPFRDQLMDEEGLNKSQANQIVFSYKDPQIIWSNTIKNLIEDLMSLGKTKSQAIRLLKKSNPVQQITDPSYELIIQELIENGFSPSFSHYFIENWKDPLIFWNKIKPFRDQLIAEEGLTSRQATRLVLGWKNPVQAWFGDETHPGGLKFLRDQLINHENLNLSTATEFVLSVKNPLLKWNDLKITRDQLHQKEGLTKTQANTLVFRYQNPLLMWEIIQPMIADLLENGVETFYLAFDIAIKQINPNKHWQKIHTDIEYLVQTESFKKNVATRFVLNHHHAIQKWHRYLKLIRNTLIQKKILTLEKANYLVAMSHAELVRILKEHHLTTLASLILNQNFPNSNIQISA